MSGQKMHLGLHNPGAPESAWCGAPTTHHFLTDRLGDYDDDEFCEQCRAQLNKWDRMEANNATA